MKTVRLDETGLEVSEGVCGIPIQNITSKKESKAGRIPHINISGHSTDVALRVASWSHFIGKIVGSPFTGD